MLSSHQYGFRMGLSTTLAIYDMQENILENLEKGLISCTIFYDLSKAFDTVDQGVLLWKLNNFFGIRGVPLKLLATLAICKDDSSTLSLMAVHQLL